MGKRKALNVLIDEDLWKRVKVACINREITMTSFVEIALSKALKDNDNDLLFKLSSADDSSGSIFEPYKKNKNT